MSRWGTLGLEFTVGKLRGTRDLYGGLHTSSGRRSYLALRRGMMRFASFLAFAPFAPLSSLFCTLNKVVFTFGTEATVTTDWAICLLWLSYVTTCADDAISTFRCQHHQLVAQAHAYPAGAGFADGAWDTGSTAYPLLVGLLV